MSEGEEDLKLLCSVCKKKEASKKLSILVDDEHYSLGKPEMIKLLYRLKELYEQEEEEQQQQQQQPQVIIDPQPIDNTPQPTPEAPEKTIDQYIHELVNQARVENGLRTLSYDESLEMVAYKHSKDMIQRNYFSHTTPEGRSVGDRYRLSNYTGCRTWGENIAWFSTSRLSRMTRKEIGEKIFNQWWTSPGHKNNILNSDFSIEGIGIYISGDKVMAAQNFCRK